MSNSHKKCNEYKEVRRVTIISVFINMFLAIIKIIGGIFGKSSALLADGIHTFSDLSSDLVLFIGVNFWTKPGDEDHPYGHKRIETLTTIIIGILLFIVAIPILYKGLVGVKTGESKAVPAMFTVYITFLSIVFKEYLYRITYKSGVKINSQAVIANAWHHRSDAMSSIPVIVALILAVFIPEWDFMDKIGAVIVAIILIRIALKFILGSIIKLMDISASDEVIHNINTITRNIDGVRDLHKVRTRYLGNSIAVDMHVLVDKDISVFHGHEIAREVKLNILDQQKDVVDVIIHIEPFEN